MGQLRQASRRDGLPTQRQRRRACGEAGHAPGCRRRLLAGPSMLCCRNSLMAALLAARAASCSTRGRAERRCGPAPSSPASGCAAEPIWAANSALQARRPAPAPPCARRAPFASFKQAVATRREGERGPACRLSPCHACPAAACRCCMHPDPGQRAVAARGTVDSSLPGPNLQSPLPLCTSCAPELLLAICPTPAGHSPCPLPPALPAAPCVHSSSDGEFQVESGLTGQRQKRSTESGEKRSNR